MKNIFRILSLTTFLTSAQAFGQEDRMIAHLDLGLQREITHVTIEESEPVAGIVQASEEASEEGSDIEPADAD